MTLQNSPQTNTGLISPKIKEFFLRGLNPISTYLQRTNLSADWLSGLGLFLSFTGGILYSQGLIFQAGWLILFSGICDVMDVACPIELYHSLS